MNRKNRSNVFDVLRVVAEGLSAEADDPHLDPEDRTAAAELRQAWIQHWTKLGFGFVFTNH